MEKKELSSICEEELENVTGGTGFGCETHFSDYLDESKYDSYFKYNFGGIYYYQSETFGTTRCQILHRKFYYYETHDNDKIYYDDIEFKMYEIKCLDLINKNEGTVKEEEIKRYCLK